MDYLPIAWYSFGEKSDVMKFYSELLGMSLNFPLLMSLMMLLWWLETAVFPAYLPPVEIDLISQIPS